MQTGASALLAAASVATLYGLVHFFDLFRRDPSLSVEAQRIDFAPDGPVDLSTVMEVAGPEPTDEERLDVPTVQLPVANFDEVETAPCGPLGAQADSGAQAKAPRKSSRRAGSASKKSKVAEFKPPMEVEPVEPTPVEEVPHIHVAPLFEPDPFHRMPRQGFGRRGQI